MSARQRLVPALLGLVIFTLLGRSVSSHFWHEWWFYVGLGMAIAVVFVEPYYSRAQDALVNSIAGVGAWAAADRTSTRSLWLAYLIYALGVLALAAVAALLPEPSSRGTKLAKAAANQIAGRLGRAVVIGGAALALEVVSLAHDRKAGFVELALGSAVLVTALAPNWTRILRIARGVVPDPLSALTATGPRLLLMTVDRPQKVGTPLQLTGRLGTAGGWIVALLPGEHGPVAEVALDTDVAAVCESFPEPLEVQVLTSASDVVGSVGPGTTDLSLVFHPMTDLRIGDPLRVGTEEDSRVYQVTQLELRRESWRGDAAVIPAATAVQVGRPESGWVRTHPHLPAPHELVYRSTDLAQSLPAGYVRIGVMKGTSIEIGVNVEAADTGHFAVLGISGMGKTSVALRICRALSANSCVIALDTTGEYRTRQGISDSVPADMDEFGLWVHEPRGDPPEAARKYIEDVMTKANAEYVTGADPVRRVLVLEEAHGFVPEQNVSTFAQRDQTALSTRMIMQSRKFELRFVLVSQRTAVVSKSALSQCENYVALRSTDETSLTYLEAALGPGIRHALPRLERYEAVCMGPAFNVDGPVIVSLDPPNATSPEPTVDEPPF